MVVNQAEKQASGFYFSPKCTVNNAFLFNFGIILQKAKS
jgi:hypothetical protein